MVGKGLIGEGGGLVIGSGGKALIKTNGCECCGCTYAPTVFNGGFLETFDGLDSRFFTTGTGPDLNFDGTANLTTVNPFSHLIRGLTGSAAAWTTCTVDLDVVNLDLQGNNSQSIFAGIALWIRPGFEPSAINIMFVRNSFLVPQFYGVGESIFGGQNLGFQKRSISLRLQVTRINNDLVEWESSYDGGTVFRTGSLTSTQAGTTFGDCHVFQPRFSTGFQNTGNGGQFFLSGTVEVDNWKVTIV